MKGKKLGYEKEDSLKKLQQMLEGSGLLKPVLSLVVAMDELYVAMNEMDESLEGSITPSERVMVSSVFRKIEKLNDGITSLLKASMEEVNTHKKIINSQDKMINIQDERGDVGDRFINYLKDAPSRNGRKSIYTPHKKEIEAVIKDCMTDYAIGDPNIRSAQNTAQLIKTRITGIKKQPDPKTVSKWAKEIKETGGITSIPDTKF